MRKKIWQLHSWVGLVCALALLVIGLTGSVLVFHEEITDQLDPEQKLLSPLAADSSRLPISTLTRTIEERFPEFWIRGWLFKHDDVHRDRVYLNRRDADPDAHEEEWFILHVDPFTTTSGPAPVALHDTLYGWFVDLHYTFFADHLGMALAGLFALGFLFLGFSGVYLHRPYFKTVLRLRWGASLRIFFSDVHKAVGIATIPMNLIFGFTGAYWNISHLAHEIIEHHDEEHVAAAEFPGRATHLDALHTLSDTAIPGYSLNYAYFPTAADPTWYLYGTHPTAGAFNSPYGSTVFISAATGEITASSDLSHAGWWPRLLDSFEPLHFGHFGGLTSQILWCLAGLAPAILALTGVTLTWRRRRPKSRRRTPNPSAAVTALP